MEIILDKSAYNLSNQSLLNLLEIIKRKIKSITAFKNNYS